MELAASVNFEADELTHTAAMVFEASDIQRMLVLVSGMAPLCFSFPSGFQFIDQFDPATVFDMDSIADWIYMYRFEKHHLASVRFSAGAKLDFTMHLAALVPYDILRFGDVAAGSFHAFNALSIFQSNDCRTVHSLSLQGSQVVQHNNKCGSQTLRWAGLGKPGLDTIKAIGLTFYEAEGTIYMLKAFNFDSWQRLLPDKPYGVPIDITWYVDTAKIQHWILAAEEIDKADFLEFLPATGCTGGQFLSRHHRTYPTQPGTYPTHPGVHWRPVIPKN